MTTTADAESSIGAFPLATVLLGLVVIGLGVFLLETSPMGGAWIAAIGISMALAGLCTTNAVGDRLALSPSSRRYAALGFGGLAVVLFLGFVVINFTGFESTGFESSG